MSTKSPKSIHTSTRSIICHEVSIKLSDEKLRRMLSSVYEKARADERQPTIYQHYGVFYSVALTLLLSLLTADFKAIGEISAETISIICWCILAVFAIVGFLLMLIHYTRRGKTDIQERDNAIKVAMDEIMVADTENNETAA